MIFIRYRWLRLRCAYDSTDRLLSVVLRTLDFRCSSILMLDAREEKTVVGEAVFAYIKPK